MKTTFKLEERVFAKLFYDVSNKSKLNINNTVHNRIWDPLNVQIELQVWRDVQRELNNEFLV